SGRRSEQGVRDVCGICGVASVSGPLEPGVRRWLPAMARTLQHRGPDGEGFYFGEGAALAHRRLAIIDREGGAQPIPNEDETAWIVFNGEIYNYRPLK